MMELFHSRGGFMKFSFEYKHEFEVPKNREDEAINNFTDENIRKILENLNHWCMRNIYNPIPNVFTDYPYVTGITVQEAKKGLITSCPHCGESFVKRVKHIIA